MTKRYLVYAYEDDKQISLSDNATRKAARASLQFWQAHGYPQAKIYDFKLDLAEEARRYFASDAFQNTLLERLNRDLSARGEQ